MDYAYTVTSKKSVSEALQGLKQSLAERSFGVLGEFNIPAKLREKGIEYDGDFHILEICNPHQAKKMLEMDQRIGYFLPCKMVIYTENESTKIGMVNPTALVAFLKDERLVLAAKEVEITLIDAIDAAK